MIAYLVLGFFAATFALMALDMLASGDIAALAVGAALAIGLGYPTIAGVLRQHRNRVAAEHAALVARAEAGHAAFLARRLDPLHRARRRRRRRSGPGSRSPSVSPECCSHPW